MTLKLLSYYSHPLLSAFAKTQVKEMFHDDVRNSIMEMEDDRDAFTKSQLLKDEGNRFFRTKDYQMAISRCDKSLQYFLCAKDHCDLAPKLNSRNVKARFRRAQALLQLGRVEEAYNDLLLAFKFGLSNQEVKKELDMVKQKRRSKCMKDWGGSDRNETDLAALSANPAEVKSFGSSNLCSPYQPGCSSQLDCHDGELDEFGQFSELDPRVDKKKKECALAELNDSPLNQQACQNSSSIEVSIKMQEDGLKDLVSDCRHMSLDSKLCVAESGLNTLTSVEGRAGSSPILSLVDQDPRVTPIVDQDTQMEETGIGDSPSSEPRMNVKGM
ncbi:hypothetical protein Cgig2_020619 [Carnegiea gigantea]|uniref:Uncharacterized protein n=1 Tax=Carnegiea gigantea TaxID=171969 RepID=A0A9Q1JYB3_9CARY|nr:hypothetical protein Cgig2_020619 [Carnegiea gigantea]